MSKSTDVLILAFNKDIATEIGEKILGLEQKNFFQPSEHQAQLINFVNSGSGNGLVQAVAGAGKTTTILQSINELRKTYQSGRMTKNGRTLRWGDGFSITSSTQHALALKVLSSHYPELKSREGFRAKVQEDKVGKIVKAMFLPSGAWFKDQNHSIIDDRDMKSALKRIYALEDEQTELNFERATSAWEKKGRKGRKPTMNTLKSDRVYETLMSKQQGALKKLIEGMVNAGVGLLPEYPLTMETARKVYTELSVEPRFIQGSYYEDQEDGGLKATYKKWDINSDGDRVPPSFNSEYSLIQKDKICYLALKVMKKLHKESVADSTIDFNLMIYKAVQNQSGQLAYPKYNFIFQDECQDTNKVTMELLAKLVKVNGNEIIGRIIGVGDVAQAIYGFRGADSYAMSNFQKKFNCTTLPLTTCYRCAKSILADVRELGEMYSSIEPTSSAPLGLCQYTQDEVSNFLSPEVYKQIKQGNKYVTIKTLNPNYLSSSFFNSDTAFIARSRKSLEEFAQLLLVNGIPFNHVGMTGTDELDVSEGEGDDDEYIGMEGDLQLGLADRIIQKIMKYLKILKRGWSARSRKGKSFKWFFDASREQPNYPQRTSVNSFMLVFNRFVSREVYRYGEGQIDSINYIENLIEDYNLIYQVMLNVLARYGNQPFIHDPSFSMQLMNVRKYVTDTYKNTDPANAITIVTAHKSKGLEFPRVILDGSTFNKFNPPRDANMVADAIQEMNMLYVAMTRAEKELLVLEPEPPEGDDNKEQAELLNQKYQPFPEYDPNFQPQIKANSIVPYMFVEEFSDVPSLVTFFDSDGSRFGTFATINNEPTDSLHNPYKIILDNEELGFEDDDIVSIRLFDGKGAVLIEKIDPTSQFTLDDLEVALGTIKNRLKRFMRRR